MKLTLAHGWRPWWSKMSREPQSRGASAAGGRLAAPEVAHRVAILVVPLGPARREAADLVAAGAAVPRLGDQLHRARAPDPAAGLQETAVLVEAVRLAREDGAEVEAEAVDVHLLHPVAQAVGHHLDDARMAQIQRVAGAGVVDVVALLSGSRR